MTIALSLKVNDGVVLASDSTATMRFGPGANDFNVYNHADKLFNVHKGSRIGAVCYGLGSIGPSSLATLMKDFRDELTSVDSGRTLPPDYTIGWVVESLKAFFFTERYEPFLTKLGIPKDQWPFLGMLVAGYSSDESQPEVWRLFGGRGKVEAVLEAGPSVEAMINWGGEVDAISRIVTGFDFRLYELIAQELKLPLDDVSKAIDAVKGRVEPLMLPSSMPMQDVIALAQFLVELTIQYSRYTPGPQTVGGPIDIAAITKHEGFKWVRRKHYYSSDLNPRP